MQSHSPYFFVPNLILILVKIPLLRQSSCVLQPFFLISTLFPPLSTNHSLLLVESIRFFFIQLLSVFLSRLASHLNFPCFLFTMTPLICYPAFCFLLSLIFSFFVSNQSISFDFMNFSFQFLSLESYFTLNTISVSDASILLVPLLIANQVLLFLSFSFLSPVLQSFSYYFSSVCTVCHGCSSPWLLNQHLCVKCSFSFFLQL